MPIATSRSASFSPNSPMPMPLTKGKPTKPASGDRPNRTTPVAQVKPTCDSAWPGNVCPRSTRKNPTVPASTAASPEATKAVRMKSYSSMAVGMVIVAMRVALDVDVAGHHEIAILDAHHFDRRAIEARQHRPVNDVVDRPDHRLAPAEIEHAVDRVYQRIELVGAEQDRNLQIVADAPCGFNDALLVRRVERDQWLVEPQQTRAAPQRPGH